CPSMLFRRRPTPIHRRSQAGSHAMTTPARIPSMRVRALAAGILGAVSGRQRRSPMTEELANAIVDDLRSIIISLGESETEWLVQFIDMLHQRKLTEEERKRAAFRDPEATAKQIAEGEGHLARLLAI